MRIVLYIMIEKKIHKRQKKEQGLANFYNIRQHQYSFVKALCKRFYGT